jgi:hypothetical protein
MLYQNLRVASAVLTTMGFAFGLSDRISAYNQSRDPVEFSLIFIALAFAVNISINYPWERFQSTYKLITQLCLTKKLDTNIRPTD